MEAGASDAESEPRRLQVSRWAGAGPVKERKKQAERTGIKYDIDDTKAFPYIVALREEEEEVRSEPEKTTRRNAEQEEGRELTMRRHREMTRARKAQEGPPAGLTLPLVNDPPDWRARGNWFRESDPQCRC